MPTTFTHAAVALAAGNALGTTLNDKRFYVWAVACSVLPDLDVITFTIGIPYQHYLGHRGFTHSVLFALLLSVGVGWLGFRELKWARPKWRLIISLFLITASHGLLDALTDGGLGIAFFAPFENARYFLPVRPIHVSPIGTSFFSPWGLHVLLSEVIWIWLPLGMMVAVGMAARRVISSRRAAWKQFL